MSSKKKIKEIKYIEEEEEVITYHKQEENGERESPEQEENEEGEEEEEEDEDEDDDTFGPLPVPMQKKRKKRKTKIINEEMYLNNLPSAEMYEKSYMHRDVITHVLVSTKNHFIITGSEDGHIKFWIKDFEGIQFVKHYRAHTGRLVGMCLSVEEGMLCSVGEEMSLKLFEVLNFDMSHFMKLPFKPNAVEFIHSLDAPAPIVAIGSKDSASIHIYKPTISSEMQGTFSYHMHSVHIIKYNMHCDVCVSADVGGGIEIWSAKTLKIPTKTSTKNLFKFDMKSETNLFELAKNNTKAAAMCVSGDGRMLAALCQDAFLRIFNFYTMKITKVYDETIEMYSTAQSDPTMRMLHLDRLDFGRRMAAEKELLQSSSIFHQTLSFDETSNYLIYPSIVGIKVLNILNNKVVRIIGKPESTERFLAVALYQGKPQKRKMTTILTGDPAKDDKSKREGTDPMLFASAYKKHRFYCFSNREPSESSAESRDIYNEKPTKEEQIASAHAETGGRIGKEAVIHTTMGDIVIRLFGKEVPRTVENFTVHSNNNYYDNCIFHRVIKGFMIQTGDPNGDGTGGESIWGGEFNDEFHTSLKHDRPFTVSMANAGPNTNGSQFFITTAPCNWLDGKHSIFGRVTAGMDVVTNIENVRVNSDDKPYKDIKILTIKIKS